MAQDKFILDEGNRTMMPGVMLSMQCDVMNCKVAWCRFAASDSESLERPKHRHMVYEMHYILSGEMQYYFPDNVRMSAGKGEFALIPQGLLHSTKAAPGVTTEYLVIAFVISSDNEAINVIFSAQNHPVVMAFSPAHYEMIKALKLKVTDSSFTDSLSTKLLVHSILLETVDTLASEMHLSYTLQQRKTQNNDPRVNSIIQLVGSMKYSQKLRGEDIAAKLGITTRQLNRISNQNFGCPISQYIINCRIEAMKELLRESYYNVRDIASIFSFADVYAFSRHFKKFSGMTPSEYRKTVNS